MGSTAKIDTSNEFKGELIRSEKDLYTIIKESEYIQNQQYLNKIIKQIEKEENERQEQERLNKLEKERKLKEKENLNGFKRVQDVTAHITYFYGANNSLQGGFKDKIGKSLSTHQEPVCALPSNVKYGSYLVLDENVHYNTNKSTSKTFKNVDTGGEIVWLSSNTLKVDIYVQNCTSLNWIENNLKNRVVKGKIYYK